MSTKNLARTVIEGGRYRGNKFDRHRSNSIQRTREREVEHALCDRLDYDGALFPRRTPVYQAFMDKLGPALRWLRAQVGKQWNDVRSELFARFDTRTTAGRHILFDHLLAEVEDRSHRFFRQRDFFVDAGGCLRFLHTKRPRRFRARERLPERPEVIEGWLSGRRIATSGEHWFWFQQTRSGHFRQHQLLAADEVRRWLAIPAWYRVILEERWQALRNENLS